MPVNGVTADNASACLKVLSAKLPSEIASRFYEIKVLERSGAWYIALPIEKDVRLSDLTSALKDSPFSISVDDLSLFGHVILEVETGSVPTEKVLSGLETISHVAVEKSQSEGNVFLVTLDLPYPVGEWRPHLESATWDQFQRNDFSSAARSDKTHSKITPQELPTYQKIRKMLWAKDAKLVDVRWSVAFWCRPLGFIKASGSGDDNAASTTTSALPAGKWKVEFTNQVAQLCDVLKSGDVTVNEANRESRGKAVARGNSVVVTYGDDRTERWTPAGKQFVVEHWFPASAFPTKPPVLGIATPAEQDK
jgi:hypothetical protein